MIAKILFLAVCTILSAQAEPDISVIDSNVDVGYQLKAIDLLKGLYGLYPNETNRYQEWSDLFNKEYEIPKGWSVSRGCELTYSSSPIFYIDLQVDERDGDYPQSFNVRIFAQNTAITTTTIPTTTTGV